MDECARSERDGLPRDGRRAGRGGGRLHIGGIVLLIYRRRTVGPVFAATTENDKFMYVFLVTAICLGIFATMVGAGVFGGDYNYRLGS